MEVCGSVVASEVDIICSRDARSSTEIQIAVEWKLKVIRTVTGLAYFSLVLPHNFFVT